MIIVISIILSNLLHDRNMVHRRVASREDLGAAIRAARIERGWDLAQLAELVGVGRMTISRLERGGPVTTDAAMRALNECGYEIAVVPKFSRVTVK